MDFTQEEAKIIAKLIGSDVIVACLPLEKGSIDGPIVLRLTFPRAVASEK